MDILRAAKEHLIELRDLASEKDSHPHTMGRIAEKLLILSRILEELESPRLIQPQGQGGDLELTSEKEDQIIKLCLEYALDNEFVLGESFTKEEVRKILEDLGD